MFYEPRTSGRMMGTTDILKGPLRSTLAYKNFHAEELASQNSFQLHKDSVHHVSFQETST